MSKEKPIRRCLLVDDEFHALELTASYLQRVTGYEVVKQLRNPLQVKEVLEKEKIDLIFLDINMPQLSGIELMSLLPEGIVVIFTTAYSEYAASAFDQSAADYLVKPFSFERFCKALEKAELFLDQSIDNKLKILKIRSEKSWIFLNIDEIVFIEGKKEYIKIHSEKGTFLTLMSLTKLENELPSESFTRIHKSYIISNSRVVKIGKQQIVLSNNIELPVARNRWGLVETLLSGKT